MPSTKSHPFLFWNKINNVYLDEGEIASDIWQACIQYFIQVILQVSNILQKQLEGNYGWQLIEIIETVDNDLEELPALLLAEAKFEKKREDSIVW